MVGVDSTDGVMNRERSVATPLLLGPSLPSPIAIAKGSRAQRGVAQSQGAVHPLTDADLSTPIEEADRSLALPDRGWGDIAPGCGALVRRLLREL